MTEQDKRAQGEMLQALVEQHGDSDEPLIDSLTLRITFDKPLKRPVMRAAAHVFEEQLRDVVMNNDTGDPWGFLRSSVCKVEAWATRPIEQARPGLMAELHQYLRGALADGSQLTVAEFTERVEYATRALKAALDGEVNDRKETE